jgi:hypothetical protein
MRCRLPLVCSLSLLAWSLSSLPLGACGVVQEAGLEVTLEVALTPHADAPAGSGWLALQRVELRACDPGPAAQSALLWGPAPAWADHFDQTSQVLVVERALALDGSTRGPLGVLAPAADRYCGVRLVFAPLDAPGEPWHELTLRAEAADWGGSPMPLLARTPVTVEVDLDTPRSMRAREQWTVQLARTWHPGDARDSTPAAVLEALTTGWTATAVP